MTADAASAQADAHWMARALAAAEVGRFTAHPNPRVGCALVRDGALLAVGGHRAAGESHAERVALAAVADGDTARGATAYVTLEPCSHHGRTPPCVDALIAAGVRRVVYAVDDPNPATAARAGAALEAAGIAVTSGVLADQARALNPGFFSRFERGRPWVRLKLAMSIDGRTAMPSGESQWITGGEARADVHRLRAEASAVATGVGTVLADDPSLTVRDHACERAPIRVVFDSRLRTPPDCRLLAGGPPVWLIGLGDDDTPRAQHVSVLRVADDAGRVDLPAAMAELARREINELLVESGPILAGALLDGGLVDELVIYMAPKLLGSAARGLVELPALERLVDAPALTIDDVRPIGADWRIIARPRAAGSIRAATDLS